MAFDPQGRLFITELTGAVRLYADGILQAAPVITFASDNVAGCIDRRLLGITVDPNFSTNHYIYVYLTDPSECEVAQNKVIRFVESNGTGSNPTVIFSSPQTAGIDQGGNIHFGPDGKLYVSVGHDDNAATAQDVTVKPGKMHRINSDGTIPSDNPVFTQTGALPSLYAIGLRNSFDFTFDDVAGTLLFVGENGPTCDDELNRVVGGYNYGWRLNYPCDDANPDSTYNTIPPLWHTGQGEASVAPTGVEVYTGTNIPAWQNGLFMCSYNDGALRHFYLSADRTQVTSVAVVQGVTCNMDLETGPDGALYYIEGGGYPQGDLKRITIPPDPTPIACNIISASIVSSPNAAEGRGKMQGTDAVAPDDVWAVGYDNCPAPGCSTALIEHWDGTQWSPFPRVQGARLNAVEAISSEDVWAVGSLLTGTLTMHWDGAQWTQVPSPNIEPESLLRGVAAASANDVWAVGYSTNGSPWVELIIHWDGIQWSQVDTPSPHNYRLNAVTAVSSDDVWAVGGAFSARALHWDGTQWNSIPMPTSTWASIVPYAIDAIAPNDIWAVGQYGFDDGTSCIEPLVLHWDGAQWSMGQDSTHCGKLYGIIALATDDVWAVGYKNNSYEPRPLIQHWDGTGWSDVSSANPTLSMQFYAVTATSGADIWAVGDRIEHWDGATWTDVPGALYEYDNHLRGVSALDSNHAWAVGNYLAPDGTSQALIEEWNSSGWQWSNLNITAPSVLNGIDVASETREWAVGSYIDQGVSRTLTAHGLFSTWMWVSSPNVDGDNYLTAVSAVTDDDVWAVGYYVPTAEPNLTRSLILHWNGSSWSIVPANEGTNASQLSGVAAVSTDDVWAVGRDEKDLTLILHWNGSEWSRVPSPNAGTSRNLLHDVSAASANDVWAVGYYGPAGTGQTLILHWGGNQWSVVPSPNAGDISFLIGVDAYSENSAWAVGNYFTGGIPKTLAMRWDGEAWGLVSSQDPGTESNYLNAVAAISANQAWAVGDYTAEGVARTLVERFEPFVFSDVPPDNTFYPFVQCLACQGIISGYSDGTFRPNNDLTRGQLSKIVSNSAGFIDDSGEQIFEDVPPGSTFYDWVNRLANRGYIGGYPCGGEGEPCGSGNLPYFRPNANATRGQISKIVSNAAGFNDTPPGQTFEDVPPSNTFYLWIERLASRGIMGGYPCGSPGEPCVPGNKPYFRWGNNATRGQTSKIVANTFFPNCQVIARP
jgi:glucose/arabinose dehydrogenase